MTSLVDEAGKKIEPQAEKPIFFETESWKKYAWILAIILLMGTMLFLLITVRELSAQTMDVVAKNKSDDPLFVFAGLSLVNSSLVKSIAILAGTAISFAGIAISFFSHEKASQLVASNNDAAGSNAKVALTAYSPGIFAVVVGAAVIMSSVLSPGKFSYQRPQTVETTLTTQSLPGNTATNISMPSPTEMEAIKGAVK
jgi:hypothetical protein